MYVYVIACKLLPGHEGTDWNDNVAVGTSELVRKSLARAPVA